MSISFKNRVVIVTGAGGALGRTFATEIASRGGAVVVNDSGCTVRGLGSSQAPADDVVAHIRAAGGKAIANYADVSTSSGGRELVEAALGEFGRIDALINNAGNIRSAWIEELSDDDCDAVIATHLKGSIRVTKAVWPHMKAQGYGRVLFTSSSVGMFGDEGLAAYGAAKSGLIGFMNVAAQEGEPYGIVCNAIMPNGINRFGSEMIPGIHPDRDRYVARVRPAMEPGFNTGLAVYLVSEACESTHSIYSSLGGRIARVFIGVADGWYGSLTEPVTADDVAAHIELIRDTDRGFAIPASLTDEFRLVNAALN